MDAAQVELLTGTGMAAALACTQIQRDRWMFEKRRAAPSSLGFRAQGGVNAAQVELLTGTAAALACTQIQRDRWMFEKRRAAPTSSRASSDPRARFASIVEVGFHARTDRVSPWGTHGSQLLRPGLWLHLHCALMLVPHHIRHQPQHALSRAWLCLSVVLACTLAWATYFGLLSTLFLHLVWLKKQGGMCEPCERDLCAVGRTQ